MWLLFSIRSSLQTISEILLPRWSWIPDRIRTKADGSPQYFLMETHYDNPQLISGMYHDGVMFTDNTALLTLHQTYSIRCLCLLLDLQCYWQGVELGPVIPSLTSKLWWLDFYGHSLWPYTWCAMTKTTNFFVKISSLWSFTVSSRKAPVAFIFSTCSVIKVVGVSLPCFDNSLNLGQ